MNISADNLITRFTPEILPYLLVATSIGLNFHLFLLMKRETAAGRKQLNDRLDALQQRIEAAGERLEAFVHRSPPPKVQLALPPVPGKETETVPIRRAKILIRAKRGERPEQIASALGIPLNEVSLVLQFAQLASAAEAER